MSILYSLSEKTISFDFLKMQISTGAICLFANIG